MPSDGDPTNDSADLSHRDPAELAYQLQGVLAEYIVVHDAVFKFSIRKLFRPIDFPALRDQLLQLYREAALLAAQAAKVSSPGTESFVAEFQNYAEALMEAIAKLQYICERLASKAEGAQEYESQTYDKDIDDYDSLVQRYRSFGARLNDSFRSLSRC